MSILTRSRLHTRDATDEDLVFGFRDGDTQCLNELINRYRRLARAKSRAYFLMGGDADDVEQEGLIGLYKAARDYEADHQVSFRVFAELCITRQVLTAVQSAASRKHQPLSRYVPFSSHQAGNGDPDDGAAVLAAEREVDPANQVVMNECRSIVWDCIAQVLSVFEIKILHAYQDGKSYQEIGEQLGHDVKAIDNALQRIKKKLSTKRPELVDWMAQT